VEVGKKGGLYPTIMNSANEAAISLFLKKQIKFTDIFTIIKKALDKFENVQNPDLETILQTNKEVYLSIVNDE